MTEVNLSLAAEICELVTDGSDGTHEVLANLALACELCALIHHRDELEAVRMAISEAMEKLNPVAQSMIEEKEND